MKNNRKTFLTTKKKLFYILFFLIIVISSILIVSCNDSGEPSGSPMETLDAPTNINIDKRILTWDAVENATGYSINFNNEEYETVEPTFDLHFHGDGGEYDIQVKAIGDGKNFWSSDWSEVTTFTLSERVANGYDELGFRYTLLEDESGYEVNKGKVNFTGHVEIPDYFGDYPVKKIANNMFAVIQSASVMSNYFTGEYCNNVTTSVKLPSKLESIGMYAFYAMIKLEEIVIPDTVTKIGESAFEGCTHLTRVVLPKNLKVIPQACFKNTALAEINLPDGLEEISGIAFACTYEEHRFGSISEQKGSTTIIKPNMVMCHINSAVSSIVIPSSVKVIGSRAFQGRENLENIVIPSTVECIGDPAFQETKWYENQPDGLVFIGEENCFLYAYKGEIPNGIVDNIPSHITGICGSAFANSNLKKIVIPDGVKLIGEYTFDQCSELSEVYLPSDLEIIPTHSFSYTPCLKSITLPNTLTQIGISAFYDSGLEKITIPESCKTIEDNAFSYCVNLTEIVIEEGVESIGKGAFGHTALKNVILPESLKSIGGTLFDFYPLKGEISYLETIYIPASLEVFHCPVLPANTSLTHIYFGGDSALWEKYIEEACSYAQSPYQAKAEGWYDFDCVYFYSEEKPETEGKYWHYVDGKITVWTYEEQE